MLVGDQENPKKGAIPGTEVPRGHAPRGCVLNVKILKNRLGRPVLLSEGKCPQIKSLEALPPRQPRMLAHTESQIKSKDARPLGASLPQLRRPHGKALGRAG